MKTNNLKIALFLILSMLNFSARSEDPNLEKVSDEATKSSTNNDIELSKSDSDYFIGKEIILDNIMNDEMGPAYLVGMDVANRLYREMEVYSDYPMPYSEIVEYVNKGISDTYEHLQILKTTDNYPTKFLDRSKLAVDALAEGAKPFVSKHPMGEATVSFGARVGELLLDVLGDYQKKWAGSLDQVQTQNVIFEIRGRAESIYLEHYNIGKKDKKFQTKFYDKVFHNPLNASPWATVEQNLKYNPKHRMQRTILDNVGPNGTITVNVKNIKDGTAKIQKYLSTEMDTVLKRMDETLKDQKETKEKMERMQIEKAEKQVAYRTARSSIFLSSSLLQLAGEHSAARAFSVVGNSTFNVLESMSNFSDLLEETKWDSKGLLTTVNTVAAIGQAVQAVLSLFIQGKSPEQMIMEQIQKLSEQVQKFQEQMNQRFDLVDLKLNRILVGMHAGFQVVSKGLHGLSIDIQEINHAIVVLDEKLSLLNDSVFYNLKDGFSMRLEEEILVCLRAQNDISLQQYRECLARFEAFTTIHSRNSLFAGSAEILASDHFGGRIGDLVHLYSALSGTLKDDVWQNINLIQEITHKFLYDSSMKASGEKLVNARVWNKYSNDFLKFIAKHKDYLIYNPNEGLSVVNRILKVADTTNASIESLAYTMHFSFDSEGKISNAFGTALDAYKKLTVELQDAIKNEKDRFQTNHFQGYDINKSPEEQEVRFVFNDSHIKQLIPCPHYSLAEVLKKPGAFTPPLSMPDIDFVKENFIPKEIAMAAHLGLGTIEVCYSNLDWSDADARAAGFVPGESTYLKGEGIPGALKRSGSGDALGRYLVLTDSMRPMPLYDEEPDEIVIGPKTEFRENGVITAQVHFYFVKSGSDQRFLFATKQLKAKERVEFGIRNAMKIVERWFKENKEIKGEAIYQSTSSQFGGWAHGDYDPEPKVSKSSWREYAILKAWSRGEGGEDLGNQLRSGVPELIEPAVLSATVAEASKVSNEHIKNAQNLFDKEMLGQISGNETNRLIPIVKAVTGAKKVLENILYLVFPISFTSADGFRSAFYGTNSLLDNDRLVQITQNGGSLDPERSNEFKLNDNVLNGLNDFVKELSHKKKGGEPHKVIFSTKESLETFKLIHNNLNPEVPVTQAIEEFKAEVKDWIRGNK